MSSHPTSLFDVWTRSSKQAMDAAWAANRAMAAAFGVPVPDHSGHDTETRDRAAPDAAPVEARLDPDGDLPEWDVDLNAGETVGVGDRVRFSKTLAESDVRRFAAASGDTNPLHLDDDWAAGTRFEGRIVHGSLAAGLISAALARLPGGVIYLSQDLEFVAPVRIGDRLTADVEVVESIGDGRFRLHTTVRDGEDVAIDGEAVVLVDDPPT